jgi:DNA-binding NtrC family response regulator
VAPGAGGPVKEDFPDRPSRRRLEELLGEERGNISALSRRLRVCTKTIYRWLRSYRIDLLNIRGVTTACVALGFMCSQ